MRVDKAQGGEGPDLSAIEYDADRAGRRGDRQVLCENGTVTTRGVSFVEALPANERALERLLALPGAMALQRMEGDMVLFPLEHQGEVIEVLNLKNENGEENAR